MTGRSPDEDLLGAREPGAPSDDEDAGPEPVALDEAPPADRYTGDLPLEAPPSGLAADFLGEVVKSLTQKAAVVWLRVRKLGVDRVRARLEALPGRPKILQARLTPDTEDALRELQDQIPHGVLQQPDGMI